MVAAETPASPEETDHKAAQYPQEFVRCLTARQPAEGQQLSSAGVLVPQSPGRAKRDHGHTSRLKPETPNKTTAVRTKTPLAKEQQLDGRAE
jgi:hypothetical protein